VTLAVLAVVVPAGVMLFAWSGLYSVSASKGHWPITDWFLHFGMEQSVETHAIGIEAPPLDDPALARQGAGHFASGCAPCHGAPGDLRSPITLHMLPEPPDLSERVPLWTAAELFWIVKHGIKYAGMPAWVAQVRDDEVWAMVAFLQLLPGMTPEQYRGLASVPSGVTQDARSLAANGDVRASLTACARCHGYSGEGVPGAPRLAGQDELYLFETLRRYSLGTRPSGIMQPVAAELSEAEMRELAAYYAALDAPYPPPPPDPDTARLELGAKLATQGAPARRIPACASCHGMTDPANDRRYPIIAGQHENYLVQQLRLWRDGRRGEGPTAQIMTATARNLTDADIEAVAHHYATLRPTAAEPQASAAGTGP
jgi:cytochrome c553